MTFDEYRELQRLDFCMLGRSELIGTKSIEHLRMVRAPAVLDICDAADTHFVVLKEGGLPECWVARAHRNYGDVFLQFLSKYFDIKLDGLLELGLNVDHVHAKKVATIQDHKFVRLAIIDAEVNQSWGSWERLFSDKYDRGSAIVKYLTIAQVAKIHGIPGPGGRLTLGYLNELHGALGQYDAFFEDDDFPYEENGQKKLTLALLLHGLSVPKHFPSFTQYMIFELENFFADAQQNPDLTLPRRIYKKSVQKWLAARKQPDAQFGFGVE